MPKKIQEIIEAHERLVKSCVRLLPSENILSDAARKALASDMAGRYHVKFYGGKQHVMELVEHVTGLARRVFKARHAFVTPLSGNLCDLSVLLAFTKPGDGVAMISTHAGYPLNLERFDRRRVPLPVDETRFNIDLQATLDAIDKNKPALVILGSSFILHPIPGIPSIVAQAHAYGGKVVYDGAHPFGLIAGGHFQDPLAEGVDVLIGSTHKSFFGPQGGLILTNSDEIHSEIDVVAGANPDAGVVLVDNPHPGRIAALGIALEEMVDHGAKYAGQVIKNARALQEAMLSSHLKDTIAGMAGGPTDSHQVYMRVPEDWGMAIMKNLEANKVLIDAGVRLGTAEATRLGYVEADMVRVGACIAAFLDPATTAAESKRARGEIDAVVAAHQDIVM
jgi:glycine hydroxymethyltransferase